MNNTSSEDPPSPGLQATTPALNRPGFRPIGLTARRENPALISPRRSGAYRFSSSFTNLSSVAFKALIDTLISFN